jgi:F-type H+-transporting ATPase subunit alpha
MKKVAWKLRLELAAYHELASFSQFASDLDPSTRKKLDNGEKLMEMLKQTNDSPIPFFKQVVVLYAWINWFLEKVPVHSIKEFETSIYQKLDTSHLNLAKEIESIKELTPEIEKWIKKLIEDVIKEGGYGTEA